MFFGTGEGKRLPNGSQDASGYVVDDRGRVFFYWLDWDELRGDVTFTDWEEVRPEPGWLEEAKYGRARQAAGLPS